MATAKRNKKRGGSKRRASGGRRRNSATAKSASPARAQSAAPAKQNPRRRSRKASKRRNTAAKRNPARRAAFRNPATGKGQSLIALALAAGGVVAVEAVADRVIGPQSGMKGVLVKGGVGYALSRYGKKLPLIGNHAESIGAGLMFLAAVDGVRQLAGAQITGFVNQIPGLPQVGAGGGVAGLVDFNPAAVGMGGLVDVNPTYM